jgi:hypothetical protein
LVTSHLGVTVQQSLGDHITLGATLKLVRGSLGEASATVSTWDEAFDVMDGIDLEGSARGDLDVGVMVLAGRMRAGLVVRNVTAPTFGDPEQGLETTLPRHARVGVAWGGGWPGRSRSVVAIDADLTRVPHVTADRRDVAVGVERWFRAQQVGLRGGVRASTVGDARPVLSGGASYAVLAGLYADVYLARGTADERAWGIAARLTY